MNTMECGTVGSPLKAKPGFPPCMCSWRYSNSSQEIVSQLLSTWWYLAIYIGSSWLDRIYLKVQAPLLLHCMLSRDDTIERVLGSATSTLRSLATEFMCWLPANGEISEQLATLKTRKSNLSSPQPSSNRRTIWPKFPGTTIPNTAVRSE